MKAGVLDEGDRGNLRRATDFLVHKDTTQPPLRFIVVAAIDRYVRILGFSNLHVASPRAGSRANLQS